MACVYCHFHGVSGKQIYCTCPISIPDVSSGLRSHAVKEKYRTPRWSHVALPAQRSGIANKRDSLATALILGMQKTDAVAWRSQRLFGVLYIYTHVTAYFKRFYPTITESTVRPKCFLPCLPEFEAIWQKIKT